MNHLTLIIALWLLTACGSPESGSVPTPDLQPVRDRLALYCELAPGTVAPRSGDSLYFTGFTRTACGGDLSDYQVRPGRFQRWPVNESEPDPARSDISRDGLLAVMWNAWANKDLQTLQDMYDWGKRRDWFMGDGRFGGVDTILTPNYRHTLAHAVRKLGGRVSVVDLFLPTRFASECDNYQCWLAVTHILLRGEIFGRISGDERSALLGAARYHATNPLYRWAANEHINGDRRLPVYLLMNSPWHPEDRLADDTDYCEEWPFRRGSTDRAYAPCPGQRGHHSGGDWSFTAWLILRG